MGFRNLCLVNPASVLTDEARWLACNALDVLDAATVYPDIATALRDKTIVAAQAGGQASAGVSSCP